MRGIGCLTVLVLVIIGFVLLATGKEMTPEQRAAWAGEKAHRGWYKVKVLTENARQGWKSTDQPPAEGESPQR